MTYTPLDTARLTVLLWKDDLTFDEETELEYLLQRLGGAEVH